MEKKYESIGIQIPKFFLPIPGTDLSKWAVIACDQFTSEPEYWQQVEMVVGDAPSTLNLLLPEVYLETEEESIRIERAQSKMQEYLDHNILKPYEGLMLVERTTSGKTRHGIMLALDLEKYDFNKGSQTLIRATEGTIIERIPPRMKIRNGAVLELPHILVLIDDPQKTVIEPLFDSRNHMECLYDFDLMLGSGHISGHFTNDAAAEKQLVDALAKLASPDVFRDKYHVGDEKGILLFAMGDGNHSLATAKAYWEKIKPTVTMDHPARYALVEIENIHDDGLEFEPIHRVLFNVKEFLQKALKEYYGERVQFEPVSDEKKMFEMVNAQSGSEHIIGVISKDGPAIMRIQSPDSNLPVGTLQGFLDVWKEKKGFETIDYVHGQSVVSKLGTQTGNIGFYLPSMGKSDLFKTVILDGSLPRKTFSMGEAIDKRFYIESRMIRA